MTEFRVEVAGCWRPYLDGSWGFGMDFWNNYEDKWGELRKSIGEGMNEGIEGKLCVKNSKRWEHMEEIDKASYLDGLEWHFAQLQSSRWDLLKSVGEGVIWRCWEDTRRSGEEVFVATVEVEAWRHHLSLELPMQVGRVNAEKHVNWVKGNSSLFVVPRGWGFSFIYTLSNIHYLPILRSLGFHINSVIS